MKLENKNPTEIEKTIEHFEERLRYAVTGGSTAISTVYARFALKVLKELELRALNMNREILSRGNRVDNGELVEGYFVKYQPCASKDDWIVGIVPDYASSLYLIEVDPKTVSFKQMTINENGESDNEHSGIQHSDYS